MTTPPEIRVGHRRLDRAQRAMLLRRPWWKPWAQLGVVALVYALAGVVLTTVELGPARWLACPLMGWILAGCLAAGHDCFHNSFVDSKRGNRVAGALWCAVVVSNFSALKHAHMVHHRFTRVDGDSEKPFDVPNVAAYFRLLGSSVLALPRAVIKAVKVLSGRLRLPHLHTPAAERDARIDSAMILAWLTVAAALSFYAPYTMVLVYWLPLAFFPPLAIIIAMPEHHGCGGAEATLLAKTRTTTSHWFARLLIWNSNYHVEHHLYPSVPSCNLPVLHRLICHEGQHSSPGYLSFHLRLLLELARPAIAKGASRAA